MLYSFAALSTRHTNSCRSSGDVANKTMSYMATVIVVLGKGKNNNLRIISIDDAKWSVSEYLQ